MFKLTIIAIILLITSVINFFAFYLSWQRRQTRSGRYFALGMLAITCWTLAASLDYAAIPIPLKVFFTKLEYTSYNLALVFLVAFVFVYAGYEDWLEKKPVIAALILIPLANILLAWTNELHGLLWSGFIRSEFGDNTVIFQHGPGFVWEALSDYLLALCIIVPLWQASRSGAELSRRQARLLFLGTLLPIAGNLIYLFQAPQFQGVDWASLTFSASGLLFVVALYGTRLLDLVPIARDKLVSSLSDGVIVLDLRHRMIDINQAAAQMLNSEPAALIGGDLTQVLPAVHRWLEPAPEQEIKTELALSSAHPRYFEVLLSPLRSDRQSLVGCLLIFRDITERKQAEAERAAWAALLQTTFDSSSAGILVLDTQGQIVLANKQVAKLWSVDESGPVVNSAYPFLKTLEPLINNFSEIQEFTEAQRRHPTEEGFMRLLMADERIFDIRTAPYYTGQTISGQVWTFENVTQRIGAETAEVLAEERRRISQEAHDGLLQGLVGLRLQLKQWHKLLDQDPARLHLKLDELQTFVADSIDEMRRFIFALRPAPLETGFSEAVRQLAAGMQRYYQLTVEVEFNGPEARLHTDWEPALFRIIQESLSNIGKHAQAARAWVEVDLTNPQVLTVTIRDDGHGFDSAATPNQLQGFGLGNMTERIKSLGGQLTIESEIGQGTIVRARVPYIFPN